MRLDPFYPIVPDARWVEAVVSNGARIVQLRIKDMSEPTLRDEIDEAQSICMSHGARLIVNDYWQLARDCGAAGVHLGQEDMADADIEAIKACGLVLGVSTHDDDELTRALLANPDYVALGPIFGTRSKHVAWPAQGLEPIRRWRALIPGHVPLVAIGGITVERATEVLSAGASSIAVIGDVLNAPDPHAQVSRWLRETEAFRA